MPIPFKYDFRNPNITAVFAWRKERLDRIRAEPASLPALKKYYAEHQAQFITDWGCTVDPRNVDLGLPAVMPFVLFPKQEEWIEWIVDHWRNRRNGLTEKSRDVGASWLAVSLAATMGLFHTGFSAGFGSRKEEYVDRINDPKSLFWKAREFVAMLPKEFRGGWERDKHAPHMRIIFPETQSVMTGEAGDNIGRGDRTSIYFVDESAHIERQESIEASLSATTNCRIDVSSANGRGNKFAEKRFGGKIDVFTFHWRDDPRKDEDWYRVQQEKLDPVTLAQEVDIDYAASAKGVLIPSAWAQAAVDACARLGIKPTGSRTAALDVADEGADLNALCVGQGVEVESVEDWTGKGDDIFGTVQNAFLICDQNGCKQLAYDGDGLGAGVRGDARVINAQRLRDGLEAIEVMAFRGSEEVEDPDKKVEGTDRTNKNYFANRKAQKWWGLRTRFRNTYRWVVEGIPCDPDEIISISPNCPNRQKLLNELSQPTYRLNDVGKIVVNKKPEETVSPNLADSVMIKFSGFRKKMKVTAASIQAMRRRR